MIYSVSGKLIYTEPGMAVIECGGVGYACMISGSTQRSLPAIGENAMLYTKLNVTQDAISMYGFSGKSELSCFKMLTGVSGIGSKTAISLLSAISPEQLAMCVASGDYKTLTRAQGIGPKQAQRICLELKDKIKGLGAPADTAPVSGEGVPFAPAFNSSEAIQALMVLGCSAGEASGLVAKCDQTLPVEQIIAQALKLMAGNI